jgi:hypothetical protein
MNLSFPTLGVPNVTASMVVEAGRFKVRKRASSSANAPPRECPI